MSRRGTSKDEADSEQDEPMIADGRLSEEEDSLVTPSSSPHLDHKVLSRFEICCRLLIVVLLITCIILVVVDFCTTRYIASSSVWFVGWVGRHPPQGILAVIAIFTIATVMFMPANVLTIGTGFAFRSAFGTYNKAVALSAIAVFFGSMLGSVCSFLLGRYLLRQPVLNMASHYPMFRAIDKALSGNGMKIMFLLRLSPVVPYNVLDYLSGVTSIPLWQYTVSLTGMLPGMIVFCAIGAAASSLADGEKWVEENRMVRISAIGGGLIFAIGGVAVASYYSKIELEEILERERSEHSNKHFQFEDEKDQLEMETEDEEESERGLS